MIYIYKHTFHYVVHYKYNSDRHNPVRYPSSSEVAPPEGRRSDWSNIITKRPGKITVPVFTIFTLGPDARIPPLTFDEVWGGGNLYLPLIDHTYPIGFML